MASISMDGYLPGNIGYFTAIEVMNFQGNDIRDSMPQTMTGLTTLKVLNMGDNDFTGGISEDIGSMLSLQTLNLGVNYLMGGSIPDSLLTLFVNNNEFTGALDAVFNATYQTRLLNVDLSNNRFTGNVPSEPFKIAPLQSFAAVKNCFDSASLPSSLCATRELTTLALDGLKTASSCESTHNFFPSSTGVKSYWVGGEEGSLPSCVFELPKLSILHLSGNGYIGSIPFDLNITQTLSDLSLSNNNLIGTVPDSIQSREWNNLDLSFNQLDGTLSDDGSWSWSDILRIVVVEKQQFDQRQKQFSWIPPSFFILLTSGPVAELGVTFTSIYGHYSVLVNCWC
eukprot:gene30559-37797_t